MEIYIEKIPGGFRVDGLELKNGKCGCTSILPCCYSYSKVKRNSNHFSFSAKASTPSTKDNFKWGYKVRKGSYIIEVDFDDARDKVIYSGFYPPSVNEWEKRGWEIISSIHDREDYNVWRCAVCKWLYKEKDQGIPFEKLQSDWKCPVCKAGKDSFENLG
ncbi:MAG: rubredoxin [Thermodesulfovibrionales bacterium]|nr:rubredoxin [Thermodesulfovibrionales bacterium]